MLQRQACLEQPHFLLPFLTLIHGVLQGSDMYQTLPGLLLLHQVLSAAADS
jgi:hypothetical protein